VALAQPGDAAERVVRLGGVEAVVWSPPAEAAKPWPVVVFSHGIRLCATQSRFLTEALSASGYLVVAPNHDDAKCGELDLSPPSTNQLGMKPASMWSDDDFRNRGDDVRKVVEALRTDAELATSVDLARLALVGHSLGGYTVLGLAGAWPSWRLAGVKAVLALSPYTQPFRRSEGLRKVGAPLMLHAAAARQGRRVRTGTEAEILRRDRRRRALRVDGQPCNGERRDPRLRDRVPRPPREGIAGGPRAAGLGPGGRCVPPGSSGSLARAHGGGVSLDRQARAFRASSTASARYRHLPTGVTAELMLAARAAAPA
jgi:dienelactone hydrolase